MTGDFLSPALPARPPHTAVLRALLRAIRREFPAAGLGVAGSVARGAHTLASDLDLVAADPAFRHSMQFAFTFRSIRVVALLLRSPPPADVVRRWHEPDVADGEVGLLRGLRILSDPHGHLVSIQKMALQALAHRSAQSAERREALEARARALLQRLESERRPSPAEDGAALMELFTTIVSSLLLRNGLHLRSKEEFFGVFALLEERDPAAHALLSRALPLRRVSLPHLAAALSLL